jgi:hypothetical protein
MQLALRAAGFQIQGFEQFSGAAGRGIGARLGIAICSAPVYGLLSDTVGKPAKRGKMRGGGRNVSENTTTMANASRNRTDRAQIVERE